MRAVFSLLLLGLLLALPRAALAVEPSDLGLGAYRALLIGVNGYDDPQIPALRTPEHDVEDVADVLKAHYGFSDVRLIVGSKATRAGILDGLDSLRRDAGPTDAVIVYFAGQGTASPLLPRFMIVLNGPKTGLQGG